MPLSADDRLAIHEVIALHGHLCDAAAYERFDEVFTADLEVDVTDLGLRPLPAEDPARRRLDAYIAVARERGPGTTLAMHVGNTVVGADADEPDGARAWSKGFTLGADGSAVSFTYVDLLVRTERGWRIRHRTVSPRRTPGTGAEPLTASTRPPQPPHAAASRVACSAAKPSASPCCSRKSQANTGPTTVA